MKKIIFFTTLVFFIILSGQISLSAQKSKLYDVPTRLMFAGDENEEEEAAKAILLREKFFPIGWSKDGKFAYYSEPVDEACGCYFAELVIQDMRTDKIVWGYSNTNDDFGEEPPEETVESFWKKKQKEFSRKLAQYGIVAEKNFVLLNSPVEYRNDLLTPELKVNLEIDNEDSVEGNIILRLLSKNKGSKTIYEKKYKKSYDHIRGAEISGVLTSPFEPRAAVIMVETLRGWEGPPSITQIKVVGASLTTGFR